VRALQTSQSVKKEQEEKVLQALEHRFPCSLRKTQEAGCPPAAPQCSRYPPVVRGRYLMPEQVDA